MVPCGATREASGNPPFIGEAKRDECPGSVSVFSVLAVGDCGAGDEVWGPSDRRSETQRLVALEFGNRIRFALACLAFLRLKNSILVLFAFSDKVHYGNTETCCIASAVQSIVRRRCACLLRGGKAEIILKGRDFRL